MLTTSSTQNWDYTGSKESSQKWREKKVLLSLIVFCTEHLVSHFSGTWGGCFLGSAFIDEDTMAQRQRLSLSSSVLNLVHGPCSQSALGSGWLQGEDKVQCSSQEALRSAGPTGCRNENKYIIEQTSGSVWALSAGPVGLFGWSWKKSQSEKSLERWQMGLNPGPEEACPSGDKAQDPKAVPSSLLAHHSSKALQVNQSMAEACLGICTYIMNG